MNKKYNFSVVYLTKDYYPMFEGCVYKRSQANFNEVNVINVDMNSSEENLAEGKETCSRLGIHMADEVTVAMQDGLRVADEYLTKNNIDTNWMLSFQHDVFPYKSSFWDDLQEVLDIIDEDKVGMIGANLFRNHENGLYAIQADDIAEGCAGRAKTGRGMLATDILTTHGGWYQDLPPEYYRSKYFVVESPYWSCYAINRKLFNKYIEIDTNYIFELWPDDLAYQFLKNGIVHISVPNLFASHDHKFHEGVKINKGKLIEERSDFNPSHMRFQEKWGFRWGVRNPELRQQFNQNSFTIYPDNALQHFFYGLKISDGPLDIDLKSRPPKL
jgi:hypothetical protein